MTARSLVFHPAVVEDVTEIVDYYAGRDPALPRRFRARLREQLDRVTEFPDSGRVLFDHFRRVPLTRFPYMAVYVVRDEHVQVLAVLPARRDPAWIAQQLNDRS